MEDIISAVGKGCRLAQALDSNLNRLKSAAQLLEKCEEIAAVFTAAIHGLRAVNHHVALHDSQQQNLLVPREEGMGIGMQHDEPSAGGPLVGVGPMPSSTKGKEAMLTEQLPYNDSGGSGRSGGVDEGGEELRLPTYGVKSDGGGGGGGSVGSGGESLQKSRKRKDERGKRTIEVAAPMQGNTEIPPDDGYTWRKYGQKEILGARFPRGYYRCTHQRLYNCPAKKQVQRLNSNPRIFQVDYRGDHTCHMSSTAPAAAFPPPPPLVTADATIHHEMSAFNAASITTSLPSWFPIELASQHLMGMSSTNTSMTMPFLEPNFNMYGGQMTNTNVGGGGGTSTSNVVAGQGRSDQGDQGANVVAMADAMFNTSAGGGVDDSIDYIFSEWEPSEGKH